MGEGNMAASTFVLGAAYLVATFVLFMMGKLFFDLIRRSFTLKEQLIERDNLALALAMGGYFIGLTLAIGGALSGESTFLFRDLLGAFIYGTIGIALLNGSVLINDWIIFRKFNIEKEIIEDQNCGVGLIEASNHIAMGLIIYGIVSGEGGGIVGVIVFWGLGQLSLILAAMVYGLITPYDLHDALEKDNAAVGAAFAGMFLGIGNIVRFAVQGSFVSWQESITSFAVVVLFGLLALPLARLATDRLILPGKRLTQELVNQRRPNIGAGVIEGVVYVSMSFLIGWCVA
jgi:uncharacterized membrane protein YjfL (UPF0719 family)